MFWKFEKAVEKTAESSRKLKTKTVLEKYNNYTERNRKKVNHVLPLLEKHWIAKQNNIKLVKKSR